MSQGSIGEYTEKIFLKNLGFWNSINVVPNLMLVFAFSTPNKCTKFQLDWFMQNVQKKEKQRNFFKSPVWLLVSWEWLEKSSLNFECGLLWAEGISTVNLVPFRCGITELWMHENHDFIYMVTINDIDDSPPATIFKQSWNESPLLWRETSWTSEKLMLMGQEIHLEIIGGVGNPYSICKGGFTGKRNAWWWIWLSCRLFRLKTS